MNLIHNIREIENKYRIHILLYAKQSERLFVEDENQDYLIFYNKRYGGLNINFNGQEIESYNLDKWFGLIATSQEPYISRDKILSFLSDDIVYKNDLFYSEVSKYINKYFNLSKIQTNRPTHLRKNYSLESYKKYASKIILSYWFKSGNKLYPKNINEVIDSNLLPEDMKTIVISLNSNNFKENNEFITETLIKYLSRDNEISSVGDISIPLEEYSKFRDELFSEFESNRFYAST